MKYSTLLFIIALSLFSSTSAILANEVEKKFIDAGLVDIKTFDNSIQVDLVNSNPNNNFFRENYYNGLQKAYLREEVAKKLSNAQKILHLSHPNFSLQILDASRPRSVSKMMYNKMKGTRFEKYVANPQKGSMHNYGIAVDITIIDNKGIELDMGISPFRKSNMEIYWQYAKKKIGFSLTVKQVNNRKLLTDTMIAAGFIPLSFEWWHFNGLNKTIARQRFEIIE